ncbi:hypothetical protein E2C01_045935 [Portunus trituberculatus]|uniref:Uncharacterized protein n=1 Tax=Portunus trituberculatus TaxID=210409 RepID=A0A5B7G3Q0_PORTR|nr:hypothetical protein [Portunus trituberculatus]
MRICRVSCCTSLQSWLPGADTVVCVAVSRRGARRRAREEARYSHSGRGTAGLAHHPALTTLRSLHSCLYSATPRKPKESREEAKRYLMYILREKERS